MLNFLINPLVQFLLFLNNSLESIGLPFHYGLAIILLTIIIKLLTYPLNRKQIQSVRAQQELQPKIAELQKKYGKDRERMSQAQMQLYKEAGINPLGGCLPMIIQMPILWALYSTLRDPRVIKVTDASFLFIKDLHCPSCTTWTDAGMANLGWLWPFKDGQPPIGWNVAAGYLVLPVVLVVLQIVLQKMSMVSLSGDQSQNQTAKTMGTFSTFMAIFFGYYSLILPASLSLYYITFNILTIAQQYFTAGWGGLLPKSAKTATKMVTTVKDVPAPSSADVAVTEDVAAEKEPATPSSKPVKATTYANYSKKYGGGTQRPRRKRK